MGRGQNIIINKKLIQPKGKIWFVKENVHLLIFMLLKLKGQLIIECLMITQKIVVRLSSILQEDYLLILAQVPKGGRRDRDEWRL